MNHIFIDANILVTVLNKEYPLFSDAARIMSLADRSDFLLFTSPVCLAIAFYFAEKKSGRTLAKIKLKIILEHIKVTKIDDDIVRQSLGNPLIHDVEDGIQYYSAKSANCHFILTEDREDFYFSDIKVVNCKEFLVAFF